MSSPVFDKIYAVVRDIPSGYVATYGQIAALAGNPRWARVVGYALHQNPDPSTIKCHRVVMKTGALSSGFVFGGASAQRKLLTEEGVTFLANGNVDLQKHLWDGF